MRATAYVTLWLPVISESKVIAALRQNTPALVNADDPYVAAAAAGSIVGPAQYAYCANVGGELSCNVRMLLQPHFMWALL